MLSAALAAGNFRDADAIRHAAVARPDGTAALRLFRQVPDLVNGPGNALTRIYVSAGLPEAWRWVPDGMFQAMAFGDSSTVTETSLRTRVCSEATIHCLKLAATGMDAEKARSSALVLAAGRVAARRAWGFQDADIVPTQVMDVTVPAAQLAEDGPPAVAAAPAGLAADGTARADLHNAISVAAYDAERALMSALYNQFSETTLPVIMQAAIGMPPCNGATLVVSLGHHYVAPHKAICDTVFDQFVKDETPMLPGLTKEEMRDIMCHKTHHVVDSPRLVGMARSDEARVRLETIGQGGAVVRLPAKFDAERAALALQAVVRKGTAASAKVNVAVNQKPVDDLVAAVTAVMEANPNSQGTLEAKKLVSEFKETHGYGVAWLAGYLRAMYNDIGASRRARSAISARTLTGLMEDFEEAVADGADHFALAQKWRKTRAKEGYLDGHGLFGAAVPKAFGAPEEQDATEVTAVGAAGAESGPRRGA